MRPDKGKVLVVDDEAVMRDGCRQALVRDGMTVLEARTGTEALDVMARTPCQVVILDLKMPGMSGMEVLRRIMEEHGQTTVIVITGYPSIEAAVEAMKCGAADFLTKPFSADSLRTAVRKALAGDAPQRIGPGRPSGSGDGREPLQLIGQTPQIKAIRELIERVGRTDSTVLIMGESGTGKEVVARLMHARSRRAQKPFVVVDCAAMVGTLIENELFGHARGSYTGAITAAHGRFEVADGGTLFLDEVSCLDVRLQSKLLRAIEQRELTRIGSNQTISVDVRVIAATNTDLTRALQEGTMREDLYYRLSVVPILLPPLRQRKADIPLLAEHFLRLHCERRQKQVARITPEAMAVLVEHDWPGNVRELSNAIERAVVLADGEEIVPELLLHYTFARRSGEASEPSRPPTLAEVERAYVEHVLRQTGSNRRLAAELLGIDRKTLWRKLCRYGDGAH